MSYEKGNVFAERTGEPEPFAEAVAGTIAANNLESRADVQSFDFRTLLIVQEDYPAIRTVYLHARLHLGAADAPAPGRRR